MVAASLSPDGHRALFASGNLIFLWDLETDEELNRVPHDDKVVDVRFSPDGSHAVSTAGAIVRVWELPPGRKPGEQPAHGRGRPLSRRGTECRRVGRRHAGRAPDLDMRLARESAGL